LAGLSVVCERWRWRVRGARARGVESVLHMRAKKGERRFCSRSLEPAFLPKANSAACRSEATRVPVRLRKTPTCGFLAFALAEASEPPRPRVSGASWFRPRARTSHTTPPTTSGATNEMNRNNQDQDGAMCIFHATYPPLPPVSQAQNACVHRYDEGKGRRWVIFLFWMTRPPGW
jgi:hypothetical protein